MSFYSFYLPLEANYRINKVAELINSHHKDGAWISQDDFIAETSKYAGLGWLLSFLPFTRAGVIRKKLSASIQQTGQGVSKDLELSNLSAIDEQYLSSYAFPSGPKTLALMLLFATSTLMTLMGIGALAHLGFLGSTAAEPAAIKFAYTAFTILATKLAISPLTLAIIAATVGFFLVSLAFIELSYPGNFFSYFFGSNPRNNMLSEGPVLANHKAPLDHLLIKLPLLSGIFSVDKYGEIIPYNNAVSNLVLSFLNPVSWVKDTLTFIRALLFRMSEIGSSGRKSSLPRALLKGTINFIFEIALTPLYVLESIVSAPVKILFFIGEMTLGNCIKHVQKQNKKQRKQLEEKETLLENKPQVVTQEQQEQDTNGVSFGNMFGSNPQKPGENIVWQPNLYSHH